MNKDKNPKVSVLMGVYNGEKYLREAIDSILNQIFKDFEFLIIDDGSTDNSSNILKSYIDPRIILFKQNNSGCYKALNLGLKYAKGKYIAILDSDDISHNERLEKQFEYLENHKECVCCSTDTNIIDEEGNHIYTVRNNLSKKELSKQLPEKNPFTHSSLMIRKNIMLDLGGYPSVKHGGDVLALIDLQKYGELHILNKTLCYYRIRQGSVDSNMSRILIKKLLEFRIDYFNNGKLNKEIYLETEKIRNSIRTNEKIISFNYYIRVGKAYLHHNKKNIARKHFKESIKYKPISIEGYFYLLLSFCPKMIFSKWKMIKQILTNQHL